MKSERNSVAVYSVLIPFRKDRVVETAVDYAKVCEGLNLINPIDKCVDSR